MKTDVITIAVHTAQRAQIIRAKLESEGIDCMLDSDEAQSNPVFAGVNIMVKEADMVRAMELISALQFEYGEDDPVVEKDRDEIITISVSNWQKAVMMHEVLGSAGIQSALLNVNLLQSNISGGVKLRVLGSDVERAMEIIKGMEDIAPPQREKPQYAMGEILVPVDLTGDSVCACKLAAELAARAGVPVRLFHAYFNPVLTSMPFEEASYTISSSIVDLFKDTEEGLQKSIQKLNKQMEDVVAKVGKPVKILNTIVRGIASDAILEYSAFNHPGLIVMGRGLSKDRTGLFMGSVSGKVSERADVPVLVIPNDYTGKGLDQLRNIAYATDFDDNDQIALERLWAITRYFAADFHCLHVSMPGESALDGARIQKIRKEFEQKTSKNVNCVVLESSDLLEGFNKFITENNIDLMAVSTHRRNILTRLFYPSLTRRIMLHTGLPMLVFHG